MDFINEIGLGAISKRIVKLVSFLKEKLSGIPELIDNSNFVQRNLGGLITFDVPNKEEVYYKLTKKGYITALRNNGIRVSPHFYNTLEELDTFVKTVKYIVERKG